MHHTNSRVFISESNDERRELPSTHSSAVWE
jgi:hypothetical protein